MSTKKEITTEQINKYLDKLKSLPPAPPENVIFVRPRVEGVLDIQGQEKAKQPQGDN